MSYIFKYAQVVERHGFCWLGAVVLITISCAASLEPEFAALPTPASAPVSMTTRLEFLEPRVFTSGNHMGNAPAQGMFVFVVTSVKNLSDSVLSFSQGDFRLIDDRGMTFRYSLAAHTEYFKYELSEGCPPPPTPAPELEDVHTTGAESRGISLNCSSERELIKSKLAKRWEVFPGGEVADYDRVNVVWNGRSGTRTL